MSEILKNMLVCRSTGLVESKVDGEVVMMGVEQGEYYGLDPIGSRIWEIIATPISVEELIQLLIKEYTCELSNCEKDVMNFISVCYEKKIIVLHKIIED